MRCTFIFTFAFLLVHASAVQLALAEGESVGCVNAVCNSRVGFDAVSRFIFHERFGPLYCATWPLETAHARLRARRD